MADWDQPYVWDPRDVDPWVQVFDQKDERQGYTTVSECRRLGLAPHTVERLRYFLDDDYVILNARLADSMGLLKGDLNMLRRVLVQTCLHLRAQRDDNEREVSLMQQLLVHRPEIYKKIVDEKKREYEENRIEDVEWITPETPEELAQFFETWEATAPPESGGVFTDALTDEEWQELG